MSMIIKSVLKIQTNNSVKTLNIKFTLSWLQIFIYVLTIVLFGIYTAIYAFLFVEIISVLIDVIRGKAKIKFNKTNE